MAPSSPVGEIGSLTNRVALITGGSSGLGRAIARAYAAAGAYVVSADVTSQPPPAPAAAESPQDHDLTTPTVDLLNADWPSKKEGQQRAEFIKCDVTDEESVKAAVAFAVEKYGRLDILVNNAGISTETSKRFNPNPGTTTRIHESPVAMLDNAYSVNVRGVWLGTKYAVAQFLKQEPAPEYSRTAAGATSDVHRGWIINIASVLSTRGAYGFSSYCMSKGAVLQITKVSALEYAKDGIHVNAIQPGYSDTALLNNLYAASEGGKKSVEDHLKSVHPWGRTGKPEDIARAALFLAGEGASWITGVSVPVDGGFLAR